MANLPPLQRDTNDIFSALPHQIRALRKALHWRQIDLGEYLLISCNYEDRVCKRVSEWENGRHRPNRHARAMLLRLVELHRGEYLRALRKENVNDKS